MVEKLPTDEQYFGNVERFNFVSLELHVLNSSFFVIKVCTVKHRYNEHVYNELMITAK